MSVSCVSPVLWRYFVASPSDGNATRCVSRPENSLRPALICYASSIWGSKNRLPVCVRQPHLLYFIYISRGSPATDSVTSHRLIDCPHRRCHPPGLQRSVRLGGHMADVWGGLLSVLFFFKCNSPLSSSPSVASPPRSSGSEEEEWPSHLLTVLTPPPPPPPPSLTWQNHNYVFSSSVVLEHWNVSLCVSLCVVSFLGV